MSTEREALIEEARLAYVDAWEAERKKIGRGFAEPGTKSRAGIRAAFAVFEKSQTPTDDEREALIEKATWALIEWDTDTVDRGVRDEHYRERRADIERVFPILFRRPAQGEPTEAQVEAGCAAFYEGAKGLTSWARMAQTDPDLAQRYRDGTRAALIAAFKEGTQP